MLVAEKKINVEDFRQMEFDGEDAYYELINGIIVKRSAPTPLHQEISNELSMLLTPYVKKKKLGKIFIAPIDVYLHEHSHVLPDLLFVSKAKNEIIDYSFGIIGVPDLIIEIISPSSISTDKVAKKEDYQNAGVPEYWLIDPANQAVEVYENVKGKFQLFDFAAGEGIVKSSIIKGFELEVKSIFPQK